MEFEWWRPLAIGDAPEVPAGAGRRASTSERVRWPHRARHPRLHLRQPARRTPRHPPRARGSTPSAGTSQGTQEGTRRARAVHRRAARRDRRRLRGRDASRRASRAGSRTSRSATSSTPRSRGRSTTTNIVVWHLGWGMQLTPPGNFASRTRSARRRPGLYPAERLNIPDTVQRLHWEPARAQELGLPTSYDYGGLRETWLCHLVTDWMGDDAWLWKLECQHRRFNFIGDTTWLTGEVVDKRQVETPQGVRSEVHIEIALHQPARRRHQPGQGRGVAPQPRARRRRAAPPPRRTGSRACSTTRSTASSPNSPPTDQR